MSRRLWATLLAATLAGAACASSGTPPPTSYSDNAQLIYQQGLEQMEGGDYMLAIASFEQVRNRYPYSRFAALAELRTGDTEYARGRYAEAIDVYQTFVKLHPTHPDVDWAAFRVGQAHYKAIPSDFFLFPSPSQRDVTEVRAARQALDDFLAAYPSSSHVPEARKLLEQTLTILAKHELAIGDFHMSRKKWQGAVWRYEHLLRTYPNMGLDEEATKKLVQAYEKLGDAEAARAARQRYLDRHPQGPAAGELRKELDGGGR